MEILLAVATRAESPPLVLLPFLLADTTTAITPRRKGILTALPPQWGANSARSATSLTRSSRPVPWRKST